MKNNEYNDILNINIGDQLHDNNIVVGIIKQYVSDIVVMLTHDNGMYTYSNIIFENHSWQTIKMIEKFYNTTKYSGLMYNLITTKGFYETDKFIVRDYLELHSTKIYDDVRAITLQILNTKK